MTDQIFHSHENDSGPVEKQESSGGKKSRRGPRRRSGKRQSDSIIFASPNGNYSRPNQSRDKSAQGSSSRPKQPLPRHIEENRTLMASSGVMVATFVVEGTSRSLLQPPRLESRGFLLPHEVRNAHAKLQKAARSSYEVTVKDIPDIEEKDLVRLIKQDLEKSCDQTLKKTPLIIPIIHTL